MSRTLAIFAAVLLIAGPAGAYLGVLPPLAGLGIYALGGVLGVIAAVGAVYRLVRGPITSRRRAWFTLVLGAAVAAAVVVPVVLGAGHPRINDITTNLENPPRLSGAPEYPAGFKAIVADAYPDLTTLVVDAAPAAVFDRALERALVRDDWELTLVDERALFFEGVATTPLFRFKDDFIVRVRPARASGERHAGRRAAIDMRSRSRDGKGDLGVNARRIRKFFADLRAPLPPAAR